MPEQAELQRLFYRVARPLGEYDQLTTTIFTAAICSVQAIRHCPDTTH